MLFLSFLTLRYCPYFCTHWNSDLILSNTSDLILTLSFLTLEFCPYFIKHYPSKHWNTAPSFVLIGISTLSFLTLDSGPTFLNNGIVILYFLILEFSPYFCKHWHCDFTLSNIGIQALFLWTLQLWPYPSFHWNSIFLNIGILTLSFLALEFCP